MYWNFFGKCANFIMVKVYLNSILNAFYSNFFNSPISFSGVVNSLSIVNQALL